MKFLDLFAGIGGFRLGMEMAFHQCVGFVEWDKFARKSYEAIHNTEGEWTWNDVSTIDYRDIPRADCWCFGFPCTDISIAGPQTGFRGNRSSLYFAVNKRLRQIKEWDSERMPTILFIENVKNFLSINNGWDFFAAQIELDEIGYDCEWQVFNSAEYGVAQNRERVFIVGHLRGRSERKVFPISPKTESVGIKIIGTVKTRPDSIGQRDMIHSIDGIIGALTATDYKQPKLIMVENEIRKMTPRECWRAQGFPDWAFDKAAAVNSSTQLYKQAGNSVSPPVIYQIAKQLGS